MTETSPTQVALRELTMLTRCYCDGEHPRLGHNCSFRRDVLTLVDNIGAVLRACNEAIATNDPRFPAAAADDIRRALLGLPADENPPWRDCPRCNYDKHLCPGCGASLRHGVEVCDDCSNGNAAPDVSEEREGPSGPG